jgi:hypothetical protein
MEDRPMRRVAIAIAILHRRSSSVGFSKRYMPSHT